MISALRRVFSLSNVAEVCLIGALPPELVQDGDLRRRLGAGNLAPLPTLDDLIRGSKPRVLLSIVGIGSNSGFLSSNPTLREQIPDTWWATNRSVSLYSFSCFSADYLSTSEIMTGLSAAIAYEGEVWLPITHVTFWCDFIQRVRTCLRRAGRLDISVYGAVQEEYGRTIKGAVMKRRYRPTYLDNICLENQSQRLRFIRGTGE